MRRLLLVEDSATDAHLAKRAITKEALADEVEWIADGEEAMKLLETTDRDAYQLILLDIKLPKLTGLDILRELQKQERIEQCPPIIVFSSSDEDVDIQAAMSNGAVDYCKKPDGYSLLKKTLKQLCEQWMAAT